MATKAELEAQLVGAQAELQKVLSVRNEIRPLGKIEKLNINQAQEVLGFRLSPVKRTRDKTMNSLQADITNLATTIAGVVAALSGDSLQREREALQAEAAEKQELLADKTDA